MLDTVGIKHIFRSLPSYAFKDDWKYLSKNQKAVWVYNADDGETLPNLTMTATPNGLYHLVAQVSLPKFLFGHNARLPTQTEANYGLQLMGEFTEETIKIPFDAKTALVSLVHFANDIYLTEPGVWQMIEKLSKRKLNPLIKQFYEDETIYFTAKGKTKQIRIYPKLNEVLDKKNPSKDAVKYSNGNLRFEYSLKKKSAIDSLVKRLDLPDRTAKNFLTEKVSDFVISELLEDLNFFELLSDDKTTLQILLDYFPLNRAGSLIGFLQSVKEYGKDFYKNKSLNYSRWTYYRNVKDCKKAKVW